MGNKVIYPIQHTAKHAHIYELCATEERQCNEIVKHK